MGKIRISESDLIDRLEDHSGVHTGYLDKKTGEVLIVFDDYDEPEQQELLDQMEQDPDRYTTVEPIGSHEGFRIMENFVASLPEGEHRTLLSKVLSWKKPFSNFRSALDDMGPVRQQWFDYHQEQLRRLAADWLEFHEIEAELVSYRKASQPQAGGDC